MGSQWRMVGQGRTFATSRIDIIYYEFRYVLTKNLKIECYHIALNNTYEVLSHRIIVIM